jgi:glycosyltransferase involved in cell wall biosynthesis
MKIAVFRAFPDPYRFSMDFYAREIVRRVRRVLRKGDEIASDCLPDPRLDSRLGRYWDQYVRYQRYARDHAADVNHIVDHGYGHLTRGLPEGRTVVTFHDAVVIKVPGVNWRTRRSFMYSLRAMRRAGAIVTPSESAKRDFLDLVDMPGDRVHVVPHGVDEAFRPALDRDRLRLRLGLSGDIVLMVGHTQPYMNVERMLRAFGTLVSQHGRDATLLKLGLPFTPDQMQLIAELDLGDRVQLAGRVASADLPAYYQAADVLLYAPLLAGFGLPPLEAMACGTPVVCSNRGAVPEVVGGAAIMADADDDAALALGMHEVFGNALKRRRMIDAGFERAGQFEWERSARRLLEIYRAVCAGSIGPSRC